MLQHHFIVLALVDKEDGTLGAHEFAAAKCHVFVKEIRA